MDYAKLKGEIKEIAEIAAGVPEEFREKCFEVLLSHLLAPSSARQEANSEVQNALETKTLNRRDKASVPRPAVVKAFMKKTEVTEEDLAKIIYIEDGEVHFLAEPSTSTITRGQIEWALLLALRNALLSKGFEVDPEDLRSMCQEKGYYDSTNFWKTFKSAKNKAFFNGELAAQGDARKLTSAGQDELATVIHGFAS